MYNNILVALADAELDHAAVAAGVRIARGSTARLHLVHVRMQSGIQGGVDHERAGFMRATEWAADELDESVSFRLIEPKTGRQRARTIADNLIRYANEQRIDLIVIGTHARGRVERSILGSVGDRLIAGTDLPILLVPRDKHTNEERNLRLTRILVPLTGYPESEQILADAAELARRLDGLLTLVQVIEPDTATPDIASRPLDHEQFIVRSAHSEEYLDRVAERLRMDGVQVESHTLAGTDIASVIRRAAAVAHADLIAIATHGHTHLLFSENGITDELIDGTTRGLLVRRISEAPSPALVGDAEVQSGK